MLKVTGNGTAWLAYPQPPAQLPPATSVRVLLLPCHAGATHMKQEGARAKGRESASRGERRESRYRYSSAAVLPKVQQLPAYFTEGPAWEMPGLAAATHIACLEGEI